MLLLVGLGNPGPQYRSHRHNVGFMALDRVQSRAGASEWREKFNGLTGRGVIAGREVHLLKPQTFMNLSGRSVQKAATQLGISREDIIVVHDEIELAFGDVRMKAGGGHGGHNGLRDISQLLGADYLRVRVGVGRPVVGTVESYVLSGFAREELSVLDGVLDRAADAVETLVEKGASAVAPVVAGGKKKPGR